MGYLIEKIYVSQNRHERLSNKVSRLKREVSDLQKDLLALTIHIESRLGKEEHHPPVPKLKDLVE